MSQARSEAGFTLTEMLVVLALLALVVSVSLPFSRQSGRARELSAAAQSVTAVLRDARVLAISRNATSEVRFDLDALTTTGPTGHPVQLPPGTDIEVTTDRDLIAQETGVFRFYPDGGSSGGRIMLRHSGETRVIAVHWLTGSIAVTQESAQP